MAQSNFTAGGGNAAVQKLKKLDQYRNADAATLRRIIEQRGARILSGKRGSEARSMNSDQAYKAGGGDAGAAKMRGNSANRNMSSADLRRLVEQKGRNAVKSGPADKPNVPAKKSNLTGVSSTNDIARLRREQEAARQAQLAKAERKPPAPKAQTPKPAAPQPSRPATSRPATPAAPKKPASPASPKDRRVSAATANRESGNYGTSRTNNPMIDDAMKARMRQREERAGVGPVKDGARYAADMKNSTKGVGPVKDGNRYASNLKPSNKKESDKGMTLAERMRKRRQSLA